MPRLQGKVAVITGGSSGIGLATATRFAEEGAYVYITGRRQKELDQAVKSIGRNVAAVQGDVTSLEDLDRLYAQIRAEKGVLDIVVANSGAMEVVTLTNVKPEQYDRMFGVNTRGLFFTVQKAVPLMTRGGSVILIGSMATQRARAPGLSVYGASKAAVRSFARSWTMDLRELGIRVNTLSPGPVDTPIIDTQAPTKQAADELRARYASMIPMGRMGQTREIAATALFLASDESSFITGTEICADGGAAQV